MPLKHGARGENAMRLTRMALAIALVVSLSAPATVLANGVSASTSCTWTTGHVGQVDTQSGSITYYADDWWNPKTGYYYTFWETQFRSLVFQSGNAPHGGVIWGYDPNFSQYGEYWYGTFTVWGDATKNAVTKATANTSGSYVLVSTTTGSGHTWDSYAKCHNGTGYVTINN